MTDDEKWQDSLNIAANILAAYFRRSSEIKVQPVEWEAVKSACEFITQYFQQQTGKS